MRFNMLTLDVDGQKINLPWSRDEPPSKDEEDAIKERVRASLGAPTEYPVGNNSYSLSVPIGRVDLLRSVVADLRELADSIEEDPDALVDTTLTIDPLRDAPRLKTFTVRVRIKPDGDSE